ncbi:MAG: substrate-binding domain-containing protein [Planctomycetota bacterium]|jgi:simple sugar transport system substrate-binding protein|nr:substrate-binding domain-containing protein [Planctomycetota bacterium]
MSKFMIAVFVAAALSGGNAASGERFKLAVVVKIGGIPWFNALEEGIRKEAPKQNVDAWQVGPTSADPALQVRAIEDLIARNVDVIGVVPNDLQVLEPVLKRARDAGIKVIVHEGPDQVNKDWDFELVSVDHYAVETIKAFADLLGRKGKYAVFVGSLTVPLHNAWADIAIQYQKEHYPELELVADRFGVAESIDDTMRTTAELIAKHPDLRGILSIGGSQGPIGAGRAVQQAGKKDEIAVFGIFSPGQGERLVKSGAIKGGFTWNPMVAGEVFVRLARLIVDDVPIVDGITIDGLGKAAVDPEKRVIIGQKLESLDIDNIDRLVQLGL